MSARRAEVCASVCVWVCVDEEEREKQFSVVSINNGEKTCGMQKQSQKRSSSGTEALRRCLVTTEAPGEEVCWMSHRSS